MGWSCRTGHVDACSTRRLKRRDLAVTATAGELCLLKTRDLVHNLIGDKWNTGDNMFHRRLLAIAAAVQPVPSLHLHVPTTKTDEQEQALIRGRDPAG